jgi:hypothetical protein
MSQYEVWCHSCNTTFPKGTKVCLHCGSRTRPDRPGEHGHAGRELGGLPVGVSEHEQQVMPELSHGEPIAEPEETPTRGSLMRAGMTVLWMVLLAAGYAWRACSQN